MAMRIDLLVNDKGTAVVKKFEDTSKASIRAIENTSKRSTDGILSKWENGFSGIGSGFLALPSIAAVSAAGVVTAIGHSIKAVIEYADSLNDLSRATNVSVETLSTLDFAAKQSGTTIQQIAGSLRILSQNMEQAKDANSEAAKSFQRLGIDVNDVGRTVESTFFDVLDGLKGREDRVALATATLGRSALELGSLAQEGSIGVRALMEEAKNLGLQITTKQAQDADAVADAFGRFSASIQGLKNEAILPTLPVLTEFFDKMTVSIKPLIAVSKAIIDFKSGNLPGAIRNATIAYTELEAAGKKLAEQEKQISEIVLEETTVWAERAVAVKSTENVMKLIKEAEDAGKASAAEYALEWKRLHSDVLGVNLALIEQPKLVQDVAHAMTDVEMNAQRITDNIMGSMAFAIDSINAKTKVAKSLFSAMANTIKTEVVNAIIAALIKTALFKAVLGFLTGGVSGVAGGALGAAGGSGGVAGRIAGSTVPGVVQGSNLTTQMQTFSIIVNANNFNERFVRRDLIPMLNRVTMSSPTELVATRLK